MGTKVEEGISVSATVVPVILEKVHSRLML